MRPLILAVLITAAGSYVSSCSDSPTPTQSVGPRTQDPLFVKKAHVVIDGVMSPGEWSGAATLPFYEGFGWPFVSSLAIGFAFTGVPALILWCGRQESFALRDKLAAVIEAGAPVGAPRS